MSTESDANRFAPPAAVVADVPPTGAAGQLAGRGIRLVAVIIDGILIAVVLWLVSLVSPINVFRPNGSMPMFMMLAQNLIVGFIVYLILNGWLLQTRGQTIGKMLFGIKVVRSDGSKADLMRLAGLRYLVNSFFTLIPFIGWLYALVDALMIFRESRKCLHDNLADTIVVKA